MSKNNPKVLVVATSRKTRGGITSVVKAHETGEQWRKFHCKWIETHRDGSALLKIWYLITALLRYICLLPFHDIVHIHVATGNASAKRKMLFTYLAKWLNKKVIIHFHPSNVKYLFDNKTNKITKKLFVKSDLILVLSTQWLRWINEAFGIQNNIKVLYNPCPLVDRRDSIRKKKILVAGTIIPRKGYETIIKGFAKIANKYPEWEVIFAGNGEIEKAKIISIENNIEKQVQFIGWVNGKEKEIVFQEASVYCLASEGEGFPMGILDAWAHGIPCVMTPVGGIPDIVSDGVNGLLFNIGDHNKLSQQLEKLIIDKDLRQRIVKETDKSVNGLFNVNYINNELKNIYLNLYQSCSIF